MKTVHIITGLGDGGAEGNLLRLVTSQGASDLRVISLLSEGINGQKLKAMGVPVLALGISSWFGALVGFWKIFRSLRREPADVVQTWMYHADLIGGVAARLAGVRTIVWGIRHSDLSESQSSKKTILIAKLCAAVSGLVPTAIIACANSAAEVHKELGYDGANMHVVPNGYDLEKFRPDTERATKHRIKWGVADRTFVLGMVARFNPQKDHAGLLKALALVSEQHSSVHCVLVGRGVDVENDRLVKQLNAEGLVDCVSLCGPRDDIPSVMAALDVHVLSSSFGEAFPNVLAEAMGCGTPCVATDVGDAAEIIGDTGWIVPPREPQLLADAILQAIEEWSQPENWRLRQAQVRARIIERYSLEAMKSGFETVWSSSDRERSYQRKEM